MTTQTFYRKANVAKVDAIVKLLERFPTADILKFVEKKANLDEARLAKVRPGSAIFEAKIRVAEFPPGDESSDEEESESPEEEAAESPAKEKSEPSEDKEEGGEDAAPDFHPPAGKGDEGGEPKKLSPEEETNDLLRQILDAIKGGGDLGGPKGPGMGAPDALDLPDIGAPDQGAPLPPPKGGPGAAGAGAPLPPPAKPKGVGAPAAFSKFDPRAANVVLVCEDVTGETKTSAIKAEAESLWPTHKVAKIRRRGSEVINGSEVDLPANNLAVVTLVKK